MRGLRTSGRAGAALLILTAALSLTLAAPAAAQRIDVTVDRTEITLEDQVLLVVRVEGASGAEPELPTLEGFRVTPAGQETQMRFINGQSSSSVSYRFLLTPQRTGTFEVAAATLEVDGQVYSSDPFQIRVVEASARPREERDLFVTARVSTSEPYVGQQVIHTWRFYRRVQVADARLEPPVFDGFLVEDLGDVREYQATVRGRQYLVSEIRRAIFPQEVGRLEITPSQLTVQAVVQSGDGGRRSLLDGFFSGRSTERRVLRGPNLALDVRPLPLPPAGFSGLVGDFDIEAEITRSELKVGESATLKITVSGTGNSQQIAEPRLPELPQFKTYDDKPTSSLNRNGNVLSGSRSFSRALVPLVPGDLTIAAIELSYFDPEGGSYRTARTDEILLRVAAADGEEDLGLTESLAPTAGKVSVRIMADDILPLHKELDTVAFPSPLDRIWFLLAGLALPPLLFLGVAIGQRHRRRLAMDSRFRRRQKAMRTALAKLDRLSAADQDEVAGLASACLREFIGDKLGVEGGALTAAEVEEKLRAGGVSDETIAAVAERLRRFEAAQYGGSSVPGIDARAELKPLLRTLDKELRP